MERWVAIAINGAKAYVWQEANTWRWSVESADGSDYKTDWNPTRRSAVEEAKCRLGGITTQRPLPRFSKKDFE